MALSNIHANDEYLALDRLSDTLKLFVENERIFINDKYKKTEDSTEDSTDKDNYLDHLLSEECLINRLEELCEELVIIGLYKKIELSTNQILIKNFGKKKPVSSEKKPNEMPKGKISFENNKFNGVKLNGKSYNIKVSHSQEINEIRLICNAVKHQGQVTSALSETCSEWAKKKSQPITGLIEAYKRLQPAASIYLSDLDKKLSGLPESLIPQNTSK